MIDVQATEVIDRSAEDILGFVMDLDAYRSADHKIGKVRSIRREGDDAVVSFRSRARGLPALARQRMHLVPGQRIDVTNVASWQDRLVHFEGSFACEPAPGGTRVTHRYVFDFKGPARWILEPYLHTWMAQDIRAEVARMKRIMETDSGPVDH
jgi:hypothetical protein